MHYFGLRIEYLSIQKLRFRLPTEYLDIQKSRLGSSYKNFFTTKTQFKLQLQSLSI